MGKWEKYLISETPPSLYHPQTRNRNSEYPFVSYPICVDQEVFGKVPGAPYLEPNMVVRTGKAEPGQDFPHKHDFDEYMLFLSSDYKDIFNLGGIVELWMGGEKHIITKSTTVFVPKGVFHGPLVFHQVDRPFSYILTGNTLKYSRSGYDGTFNYKDTHGHIYDNNFISETPPNPLHPDARDMVNDYDWVSYPIHIDNELDGKLPGAFWHEANMITRPSKQPLKKGRPMNHTWDEYIMFLSMNADNLSDLGGETSVSIGDEEYLLTKSTALFAPRGIYHDLAGNGKVDRPFWGIGFGYTPKYSHLSFSNDPKHADGWFLDEIAEVTLGGKKYQFTRTYAEYVSWLTEQYNKNRP
jgi:hypothetical protein